MKKIFSGWALPAVAMAGGISCGGASGGIEGVWVEPNPIDRATVQGIELRADGSAESIGMKTLLFRGWSRTEDGRLVLSGESIGNGVRFPFADTLTIERIEADSLILSGKGGNEWRLTRRR